MNYVELIATAFVKATNSPDTMLPVFKQVVIDATLKTGHKLEETDMLDELPPQEAEKLLAKLLKNKARLVAMVDAGLPSGTPSVAQQGAFLSQIESALATMQQPGYVPPARTTKPKPAKWAPARWFKRKRK